MSEHVSGKGRQAEAGARIVDRDVEFPPPTLDDFTVIQIMSDFAGITSSMAVRHGSDGFRKRVLLKSANEPEDVSREVNQRLVEEARVGMRVSHPNLVQVLDLGKDDGRFFLLRSWVVGLGLRALLSWSWRSHRPLPPAATLRVGVSVARALDYLHTLRSLPWAARGISHRVVTPANILISAAGEVRLANLSRANLNPRFDSEGRTVHNGYPAFAAPEILEGARASHAADVFGLGAVLYEALGGEDSLMGAPESDWTRTRPRLELAGQVLRSDLPARLRKLLAAALSRNPGDRPSAREMKQELRSWMFDELDSDGEDALRQAAQEAPTI